MKRMLWRKFLPAALLALALLPGCGQMGAGSNAGDPSDGTENTEISEVTSETSEGEEAPEILFDTPSDTLTGLYQVNTDYLTRDDYVIQAGLLGENLVLYTENYGGTGDNALWLENPYTGELLQTVDLGLKTGTVRLTGNGVTVAVDGTVSVYDSRLQLTGSFKPTDVKAGNLIPSPDMTRFYGISSDGSKVLEVNAADGTETEILAGCLSDPTELQVTNAGEDWLLLQSPTEEVYIEGASSDSGESAQTDISQFWSISGNCLLDEEPVAFEKMSPGEDRLAGLCTVGGETCLAVGSPDLSDLSLIIPREMEENMVTGIDNGVTRAVSLQSLSYFAGLPHGYTCRAYDLSDGSQLAEMTFHTEQLEYGNYFTAELACVDGSRDVAFIIGYGNGYQVYAWPMTTDEANTQVPATDVQLNGSRLIALADGLKNSDEDLTDVRAVAETIGSKYGVTILAGDAVRDTYDEKCYSPTLILTTLTVIDQELARYPDSIFSQISRNYGENLVISLMGEMTEDSMGGKIPTNLGGSAGSNTIQVNMKSGGMPHIINHEMLHIMEWQMMACYPEYWEEWQASSLTLPEGFTYGHDFSNPDYQYTISGAASPEDVWFVDDYGSTNGAEDMARIFEYAMMEGRTSNVKLEDYPHLKDKLQVISDNIRKTFDTENWPEVMEWEKPLQQ